MSEAELIHSLNYKSEKLFNVIDIYDSRVSPIKEKNPSKYNEIMTQVYKNTHKSTLSGERLNEWIDNFPNMVDRKIEAEKKKLKKKLKSSKRVKKSKRIYITSPLRNRNILNKMDKLGYYSINAKSKRDKMKAGLKDDEIIADLVEEISDPYGGDHDMVEVNYDQQFKDHLEAYKERYKYVYAVEDVKPKKKDVLIRKDIISIPKKPKKKRPVKITPVKKPTKKKLKLFSSVILSENPIKITPVKELEHVKKKPVKKKPVVKKKPPVKKPKPKKKPVVKKKPIVKKEKRRKRKSTPTGTASSVMKAGSFKKWSKQTGQLKRKKKPIVKKKPPVKKPKPKKKPVVKKKPLPKVKTMRAKKRNSPITGRWTARYRMINKKKRKIKIRRWKGKIQTRILN